MDSFLIANHYQQRHSCLESQIPPRVEGESQQKTNSPDVLLLDFTVSAHA